MACGYSNRYSLAAEPRLPSFCRMPTLKRLKITYRKAQYWMDMVRWQNGEMTSGLRESIDSTTVQALGATMAIYHIRSLFALMFDPDLLIGKPSARCAGLHFRTVNGRWTGCDNSGKNGGRL